MIDGRWYAVAAVRGEDGVDGEVRPSPASLDHAETAADGAWELSLLRVPDGVERVWGGSGLTPTHRPPSG